MIIAEHLRKDSPGSELHKALGRYVEYTPACPWPEDCLVQWGHGIVPANPFFEAFPGNTFIRGDGETIEEAERLAFAKYERQTECDHNWGRQPPNLKHEAYLSGYAWCRKCRGGRSEIFPPVFVIGKYRKPLNRLEADYLRMLEEDHEMNAHMDAKYPHMKRGRARSARLLRIRKNLFGAAEELN